MKSSLHGVTRSARTLAAWVRSDRQEIRTQENKDNVM